MLVYIYSGHPSCNMYTVHVQLNIHGSCMDETHFACRPINANINSKVEDQKHSTVQESKKNGQEKGA